MKYTDLVIFKSSRTPALETHKSWVFEEAKIEHLYKPRYPPEELELVKDICVKLTAVNPVGYSFCTVQEVLDIKEKFRKEMEND
jgi:hypothetical protein